MTIRDIITVPDARLKTVSQPVAAVTDDTRRLMDDMVETMHAAQGIGLAAIQIGEAVRVIVTHISRPDEAGVEADDRRAHYDFAVGDDVQGEGVRYFVNPEIIWTSEETGNYQEGCLSVPGFYDDVTRPLACRVKFLDYDGTAQEADFDGLPAVCIQHEIDHLNGVVFLDHLSRLKRDRITAKLRKLAKEKSVG